MKFLIVEPSPVPILIPLGPKFKYKIPHKTVKLISYKRMEYYSQETQRKIKYTKKDYV